MYAGTRKRANTLSVRRSDDELAMLDTTCDYVRHNGRTALGEPTISRAHALKQLATLGYKKIESALRREAAAEDEQPQRPTGDTARTFEAPDARATPASCSQLWTMVRGAVLPKPGWEPEPSMSRGPRWTEAEDTAIERATFENLDLGILDVCPRGRARGKGDYAGRLQRLAGELGRSYPAVLKRAQRRGATSYEPRKKDGTR